MGPISRGGGVFEPWLIAHDVLLTSVYAIRDLLKKYRFHLWDCPAYLWMHINKKQLGSMWRYLSEIPPARILQVMLEVVLHTGPNQYIVS